MMKRSLISAVAILAAGAAPAQGILNGEPVNGGLGFNPYTTAENSKMLNEALVRSYMTRRDEEKKKDLKNKKSMYDSLDGDDSRFAEVKKRFVPPAKAVPEPGTMIALGAGLAAFLARKKKRAA